MNSQAAITKQAQFRNFTDFMSSTSTTEHGANHPVWHVHLFMADMFGALTAREFTECEALPGKGIALSLRYTNRTEKDLPPPAIQQDYTPNCLEGFEPMLNIAYEDVHANIPTIGELLWLM